MNKITPDMTIAAVLAECEGAADILLDFGLMCAGCQFAQRETLKDGANVHGIVDDEFDRLLNALNTSCKK